jgi:hypothetical protein
VNLFLASLPFEDHLDFRVDNIVRRERMPGCEQYADVAIRQLLLDLTLPIAAAWNMPIDPDIEYAVLDRRC